MDYLQRPRNVSVHAEHGADSAHEILVVDHFVGNWHSKVQHLQISYSCLLDVSVHINLIVELLVVLDDEALVRSVLAAL